MKKRQTKVVAYRKSRAPTGPVGLKNDFEDINFLKGLKWLYTHIFYFNYIPLKRMI